MRRLMFLSVVISVGLLGVVALDASPHTEAQTTPHHIKKVYIQPGGESVFEGATPESLAIEIMPSSPPQPAALALQRVHFPPGSRAVTPGGDPRVVLVYIERGTLTVTNTLPVTVTRGEVLATPGVQTEEIVAAETEFTLRAGDSFFSPAGSGGELRNDGSEDVSILASIIVPISDDAGTPWAGTPVP